jgi:hypothetical protein
MLEALRIVTAVLIGLSTAMGLAHLLELPGKLRLTEAQYRAVQPIYYPGFTIGGFVGEFGGIILAGILAALTPAHSAAFWPTAGALAALIAMHATYWLVTHPVNQFWVTAQAMGTAGRSFFGFGAGKRRQRGWRALRNQWELSQAIRAVFALIALVLLLTAIGH